MNAAEKQKQSGMDTERSSLDLNPSDAKMMMRKIEEQKRRLHSLELELALVRSQQ